MEHKLQRRAAFQRAATRPESRAGVGSKKVIVTGRFSEIANERAVDADFNDAGRALSPAVRRSRWLW